MNLRFLKITWLIVWQYFKRNIRWLILGTIFVAILIITQTKLNLFHSTNIIRIGLVGTYQEHDLPDEVIRLASEGLVRVEKSGKIKPNLVSGWEVNNDATEFKFKLKDGIRWADHTFIKSPDLEFSIPNVEVNYPDDKTIQFKLKEAYSPLPTLLTKPIFKKGTFLGTGPYQISKIEKSRIFITKITLNPPASRQKELPIIHVRFYPSEKVAVTGFNLGEVDLLEGINNPKLFESNPLVNLKQNTDYAKIVVILYYMNDPLLGGKNRSLRQALSFIIPQIKNAEIADNPYPPASWAFDKLSKKYLANPEEAKAALERKICWCLMANKVMGRAIKTMMVITSEILCLLSKEEISSLILSTGNINLFIKSY